MRIHANDANIKERLYFRDTQFRLSRAEDFIAHLFSYAFYIVLLVFFGLALFSGVSRLFWFAVFLGLFLLHRGIRLGRGDRDIPSVLHRPHSRINVAEYFSPAARRILSHAYGFSRGGGDFYLFLLKELSYRSEVRRMVSRLGVSPKEFAQAITLSSPSEDNVRPGGQQGSVGVLEDVSKQAFLSALSEHERSIQTRTLFGVVVRSKIPSIKRVLDALDIRPEDVEGAILLSRYSDTFSHLRRVPLTLGGQAMPLRRLRRNKAMNRALTSRPTPYLDQFGEDVTELIRRESFGLLVGHAREYDQLLDALSRPGKPNALLVGEPGVGKSTLVYHLVYRILHDDVPEQLFDKRVVSLSVSRLLSGAGNEEIAKRLERIAEETARAGNILVYIPDIHNLFKTSEGEGFHAIDLFLPIIKSGAIPLVGETYPKEFKEYIESNSEFVEQFEIVRVEAMSKEEALRYLVYTALLLERQMGVVVTTRSLRACIDIADRFQSDQPLPASAVDFLKESLTRASREKVSVLTEEFVSKMAEEELRMPVSVARGAEASELLRLEEKIHERYVNQDDAVTAVSNALREYRSGLSRKGGPIAVFLFLGPTGVGKTELSKMLAQVQFGSRDAMRRFDMTEYQEVSAISRIIGSPNGKQGGDLTEAIREYPYSLVLLDEFEKAHPDLLNVFLQLFDDGRLTDNMGRTIDFQHTIIVATSNAHSRFIKEEIEKGRGAAEIAEELKGKLTEHFRPELINRFSDIIVFRDLTEKEISKIASFLLKDVSESLSQSHGIELVFEDEAVIEIARRGYSKVFGARPLRKVISQEVRGKLAEMILREEIRRGQRVRVGIKEGEFYFDTM